MPSLSSHIKIVVQVIPQATLSPMVFLLFPEGGCKHLGPKVSGPLGQLRGGLRGLCSYAQTKNTMDKQKTKDGVILGRTKFDDEFSGQT